MYDCHTTTNPPAASIATRLYCWSKSMFCVLTTSSPPCATPAALNRRAITPSPVLPSCPGLDQETTKSPSWSIATEGCNWSPAVVAFTRNSAPAAMPAALNRWA